LSDKLNWITPATGQRTAQFRNELGAVDRKLATIVTAIEHGLCNPAMKARMADLESATSSLPPPT
jgi:hypothetical protein